MAEKMTGKPKAGLDKAALRRCVQEINKAKEKAAEYTGSAGKATATAVETYGFDKKALTFCAQLARKEPDQQLATLSGIITYAAALGMFAQMDMFNDAVSAMKDVVAAAEAATGPTSAPGASTIATLAAVN